MAGTRCNNCKYYSLEYAKFVKAWVYTCNYKGKGCVRCKPIDRKGKKAGNESGMDKYS